VVVFGLYRAGYWGSKCRRETQKERRGESRRSFRL